MMNRKEIDRIENYLANEMSEQERLDFESEMTQNQMLQLETEAHKMTQEVVIDHELIALKGKIRNVLDKKGSTHSRNSNGGRTALTISGILFVSFTIYLFTKNSSGELLLKQITPPEKKITAVKENNQPIEQIQTIETHANASDSPNARTVLLPIKNNNEEKETLNILIPKDEPNNQPQSGLLPLLSSKELSLAAKQIDLPSINVELVVLNQPQRGGCLWQTYASEIEVVNECKSGTIKLPEKWLQQEGKNDISVLLLPDSVKIENEIISSIATGNYTLYLADSMGCKLFLPIIIEGNECQTQPKAFSPEKGEILTFNLPANNGGNMKIFDRKGILISELIFNSDQHISWNGYSLSGGLVPLGAYIYIARSRDGVEIERGTLHVIR